MTTTRTTDSAAMTAAEFRCLTEYLGLDQRAVARVLGVEERTVRRWIAGTHTVPAGAAEDLLRIDRQTADFVEAVVSALQEDGPDADGVSWVVTYPSDAAYRLHHPDLPWPAAWHRAAMQRVAERVPWARLDFVGEVGE